MASYPDPLVFQSIGRTDRGCVRQLNEDSLALNPAIGLWAVADGVGGHDRGDYASGLVTSALNEISGPMPANALLAEATERILECNDNLRALAANEGLTSVATTVVVLLCSGAHYAAIWAGDSRIYLLRDGELQQLSKDHSVVQELMDSGAINAEQALTHPSGNVITRAIGASDDLSLDRTMGQVYPKDRFLLCSDGITKVLRDAEICEILSSSPLEMAVDRLFEETLSRGAPDNLTVIVVQAESNT